VYDDLLSDSRTAGAAPGDQEGAGRDNDEEAPSDHEQSLGDSADVSPKIAIHDKAQG
jgi:hypothetical protein